MIIVDFSSCGSSIYIIFMALVNCIVTISFSVCVHSLPPVWVEACLSDVVSVHAFALADVTSGVGGICH